MISAIVPVYNRSKELEKCIASLKHADEIIVVDDGSSPAVPKDKRYRLFRQENSGPALAKNLGIKNAKGNYLLFVDSDCVLEKDFFKKLKISSDVTVFNAINPYPNNIYAKAWKLLFDNMMKNPTAIGNCYLISRKTIEEVGSFNPKFISKEDVEYVSRLKRNKIVIKFNPDISVVHYTRTNFWSRVKQFYWYAKGQKQLDKKGITSKTLSRNEIFKILSKGLSEKEIKKVLLASDIGSRLGGLF